MRLLRDRILVKRHNAQAVTASGIVIPDSAQKKTAAGIVVEIGQGNFTGSGVIVAIDLSVGDYIVFEEHAGWPLVIEGVDHQIIREQQVLYVGDGKPA